MSSSAVNVEVRLKLTDAGTAAGLKSVEQAVTQAVTKTVTATEKAAEKSADAVEKGAARQRTSVKSVEQEVTKAVTKTVTATEKAAQKAAEAVEKSATRQRTSHERLSRAREVLGMRSEQAIQREIQQTEAAYQRLMSAGVLSAEQQGRALDATKKKVTALTNEMGKLTAEQQKAADAQAKRDRFSSHMQTGAAALAGGAAAMYALKAPAERAMSYDQRLAGMANTAYAERDAAGRKIGMKTLEDAVNKARKVGGGTREQAAEALDTMIASGTISDADAIKMLPGIMKASAASGADANSLATIAIRAKQSFKIAPEDVSTVLGAAMAAGQAGGFELKDMAKWLPQQMAMAGNLGLSGKEGFAKLAAWNQASVITAGTKDEGGNNLRDLLNELNTPHFRNYMAEQYLANGKKAKKGEKEGLAKSVDQVFLDYQGKGIDKVSATVDMMEKVFAKNEQYQALQTKLKALGKDDKEGRAAVIEAMAAQVQGTAVGKVFHNQQSLMAFLGLMNNQSYVQDVLGKVRGEYVAPADKSAVAVAHEVVSSTAGYKVEQAKEDAAVAQKVAMDNLTPAIGIAAKAFSDLAEKYPNLTAAAVGTVPPLLALAGAAGYASITMGKGIPGASLPSAGAIGRYGAVGIAGAVGYGAGTLFYDHALAGNAAGDTIGRGMARVASFFGSKEAEAALRAEYEADRASASPGKYNAPRGAGALGSGTAMLPMPDFSAIKDQLKPAEQKPVDVNFRGQLGLAPGLVLQSQSMQATGGHVMLNTGNLWTGVPR